MACFSNISSLPQDCVSRIISLTSPKDACRMLVVSREFQNPSESNLVWDSFLPNDDSLISLTTSIPDYSFNFSSKKQLFLMLSNYILIDGGNKAFALQKSTGRKSYILSAKHLEIFNGELDNVWSWKSIPEESRFSEVAELKTVDRLEIQGRIRSEKLSPNTKYGVYLLIKICDWAFGLDSIPCEISILSSTRGEIVSNTAYLRDGAGAGAGAGADSSKKQQYLEGLFYGNRVQMLKKRIDIKRDERLCYKRKDGWLEIEFGEFFNGQDQSKSSSNEEIIMNLMEVKGNQFKGGLIVEGIEIRPKE